MPSSDSRIESRSAFVYYRQRLGKRQITLRLNRHWYYPEADRIRGCIQFHIDVKLRIEEIADGQEPIRTGWKTGTRRLPSKSKLIKKVGSPKRIPRSRQQIARPAGDNLDFGEPSFKIVDDILSILDPHSQPEQSVGYPQIVTAFTSTIVVRYQSRMSNKGFDTA